VNFGRQRQHVMLRAADPVCVIFRDALVSHGHLIVGLEMGAQIVASLIHEVGL